MGISNPRLSVPRDPPVWCEAETGSAANITPELPAEQEKALSKHGRRRAVINPRPRMVGRSGRLGAATRVVPQRFLFRLCLLEETKAIFFFAGEKQLPTRTVGRMPLLRCPKFLRCLTADAGNFDRGHSLTSLSLPLAALSSLPTAGVRTGFAMTGYKECGRTGRCRHRPLRTGTRCAVGRATARVAPTQKSLPCLKGGGPTEGWGRDTCGENGCAFAVSSCGEESPSHGFAVPAPFRQGGRRDGGYGLPHQRHRSLALNDMVFARAAVQARADGQLGGWYGAPASQ